MSRQAIRDMKRAVGAGARANARSDEQALARESALALLARSIGFGHRRLAVIRLATAVQAGSDIPPAYCVDLEVGRRRTDLAQGLDPLPSIASPAPTTALLVRADC